MNLYPVKAKIGGGQVRNLRLRSGPNGTVVWRMHRESGHVEELIRTAKSPERVGATQSWRLDDFVFEPQRGCGCNHPMYTWVPPDDE